MGKVHRIHVRGKQRKDPDAALVAQAIILLGRELWEKRQARRGDAPPPPSDEPGNSSRGVES